MSIKSILAIGSHPDDVELGCAGALLAHRQRGHRTNILVMSEGEQSRNFSKDVRVLEQKASATRLGSRLFWGGFVDCEIPDDHRTIDRIEAVMDEVRPDVIYVHAPDDAHQDHRFVSAATVSAARRSCRILFYQSPSTTRFDPTVFVDVRDFLGGKLDALECHASQVEAGSVQLDALAASARHWGAFARITLAEAFVPVRFVWDLSGVPGADESYVTVHSYNELSYGELSSTGLPSGE